MKKFKSTLTALVTPFKDGVVDVKSLEKLVAQQIAGGVDGFVVNGTTAESPTLTESEVEKIFSVVKASAPAGTELIIGVGSNSTATTIEATKRAESLKADGVLVVVPYYNKPPQRGLRAHFEAVAKSTSLPVILYNVPGRTITSLETQTIKDLSVVQNIVGIKEASGKIDFAKEIITACGAEFTMLSGDDGTYVEFLAAGGHGVISVATHVIPAQMVQWKKWVQQGAIEQARADIVKYSKLIDLLFCEANPIPVKMALYKMGILASPELRLPLVELSPEKTETLVKEMKAVGVL